MDDLVEQCPNVVPESVCQPDPTTMQQHIDEGAVTLGRGQGKISGKRDMYAEVAWYKFFASGECVFQSLVPLACGCF